MSWQLFDRIAAFTKQINLYRRENLFTDQSNLDRLISGGEFLNFGHHGSLLEQTNLQINRLERYKDFDQMDETGVVTISLDIYADESTLIDPELKHAVTFKAKSKRVKRALEDLFYNTLMIDNMLRPMVRYLCKYGDFAAEIIPTKNRSGIASIKFMNVYNFTRVETRYGDLVGFFFQDRLVSQPIFLHPWQVMHLRLTSYENIYHPYGRSILDGARKHFKQLRLMEDAALIYRLTRAPEKRVFTIPIGNIPTHEVPQYMEIISRQFKKRKFFDPATGDVNERWSPLIQEDDFFLPQRSNGEGPQITTLPGAENLDDIKDIEYFKKNMVSGLKIPFSRVGLGDSDSGNERSLSQISPEFARSVQYIQREVAMGLKKIAIIHLALNGFQEADLRDFDVVMTASSAIDELYRIETWQSRANVIDSLRATEMFPNKWILRRFTDMTDDEMDENQEELKKMQKEGLPPEMGGIGGGLGGLGGGLGGPPGLDIGGPPPGGMPPDLEAPPGEPVPVGAGMGDVGEGLPAGAVPEGYDIDLEKELLLESHGKIKDRRSDSMIVESGFGYLLSHNELDGLNASPTNSDNGILVESVIDKNDKDEAINSTRTLLIEGSNQQIVVEPDEVTINDLPVRTMLLK